MQTVEEKNIKKESDRDIVRERTVGQEDGNY